jgi:L-alanine-DL-glutamate epimerase-like enolase superfamily enzyme
VDLKARLLELPLTALLPAFRDTVPVYGSGGFTSYSLPTLERQLSGWVADGIPQVKIKVGRHPDQDEARVRAARAAIGDAELFLSVAALCDAHTIDLSAHTAPSVSAHATTAVWHLRHLEYFHDHVRLEQLLFDGALSAEAGALRPDTSRHGLGLQLKQSDAEQFQVA